MNSGRPRPGFLLADAMHRLRRPPVPTLIAILVILAGTTSVFATTGLAVASQQRTLDRINSPQGRLITVTDPQGSAGLSAASVAVVATLSGVEWAIGIGASVDVSNVNLPGGATATARRIYGTSSPVLMTSDEPSEQRQLAPGQALAGPGIAEALGMVDGIGAVTSRTLDATVVGAFRARPPLQVLNDDIVVAADPTEPGAQLIALWVSVSDVADLALVTDAVSDAIVLAEPGGVRIETSEELALLGADVAADLARTARLTITGLLGAITVLVGAVQFGRVSATLRDIGRARALGASRSTIVLQVLVNATLCAVIGAALGAVAGVIIIAVNAGTLPTLGFMVAVPTLVVLAAVAGSVPPALRAASLDPVRILRVP